MPDLYESSFILTVVERGSLPDRGNSPLYSKVSGEGCQYLEFVDTEFYSTCTSPTTGSPDSPNTRE